VSAEPIGEWPKSGRKNKTENPEQARSTIAGISTMKFMLDSQ
jgi:hypothetical protein